MIDSLMMRAGTIFLLVGMAWGIEMGIRQDFSMAAAHAHDTAPLVYDILVGDPVDGLRNRAVK